jgi:hypothetical protein
MKFKTWIHAFVEEICYHFKCHNHFGSTLEYMPRSCHRSLLQLELKFMLGVNHGFLKDILNITFATIITCNYGAHLAIL